MGYKTRQQPPLNWWDPPLTPPRMAFVSVACFLFLCCHTLWHLQQKGCAVDRGEGDTHQGVSSSQELWGWQGGEAALGL